MKQTVFEIVTNKPLTESVYEMTLKGDTSAITHPGQFVELSLEGYFLRRHFAGDKQATAVLAAMKGQLPAMYRKYFDV